MDVISLSKANKAKRTIQQLDNRLGEGVQDVHPNVKIRLEELEKKKPDILLYNRVSEIEAQTAINLNKHNLRVSGLLNKNRYQMTDLIIDDFGDDTGIDKTQSIGYLHDAVNKKVILASGQTQAEIVTTSESLIDAPQMIIVNSLSVLYELLKYEQPTLFVSRDNGVTWKEVAQDTLTNISDLPEGTELKVKAVLSSGQELYGLSYSWI